MFKRKNKKKIEAEETEKASAEITPDREFFYNLDEIEAEAKPVRNATRVIPEDTEDEDDSIIVEEPYARDSEQLPLTSIDTATLDDDDNEDWVTEDDKLLIDVYQDNYNIYIVSPMPGVETDAIDININNDMITIRGRRQEQTETHEDDFFFRECSWGNVSRSVILPVEIDAEKVQAALKNGILTVTLPKVGTGRDITINVRDED